MCEAVPVRHTYKMPNVQVKTKKITLFLANKAKLLKLKPVSLNK